MAEYRYTECGLDNVLIVGVSFISDDAGEECIDIPNVHDLHRAIAEGITKKRSSMTGRELRFLRTEMGMTQAELARLVHREPLAISRWERGEVEAIDSNAEALIRLHAIQALEIDNPRIADLSAWCTPAAETPQIIIDGSQEGQYHVAA
ncbi:MAG: helix-turn-helix domain-containing protein [Salinarimonas sp.]|jgi:DNA-binding transcriptional regulator YiaG|uniref:DNA-binding transcriptional regulator YiaG, contains XRE-type HTH domain n=1 Tax=Saliniramus fredricksonii TaxID=1653334 RepID=A0A0P8BJL2_9HYPH|nr:helix-turn-helix domain-containing protein [Saliniramus fredricksonii]KPQ09590.1 MAG: putative transcriptional regulator [Saliniramus fredricksonii]SCC80440.1 DNA-binding transcriptional regulator YiaG, contains XRE-type HTH domain [Saliniramus fredricksonii]